MRRRTDLRHRHQVGSVRARHTFEPEISSVLHASCWDELSHESGRRFLVDSCRRRKFLLLAATIRAGRPTAPRAPASTSTISASSVAPAAVPRTAFATATLAIYPTGVPRGGLTAERPRCVSLHDDRE